MTVGMPAAPGHPEQENRGCQRGVTLQVTLTHVKKLLPHAKHVTNAGSYGNEYPVFFWPEKGEMRGKPSVCWAWQKLARHLLYVFVQEQ